MPILSNLSTRINGPHMSKGWPLYSFDLCSLLLRNIAPIMLFCPVDVTVIVARVRTVLTNCLLLFHSPLSPILFSFLPSILGCYRASTQTTRLVSSTIIFLLCYTGVTLTGLRLVFRASSLFFFFELPSYMLLVLSRWPCTFRCLIASRCIL